MCGSRRVNRPRAGRLGAPGSRVPAGCESTRCFGFTDDLGGGEGLRHQLLSHLVKGSLSLKT